MKTLKKYLDVRSILLSALQAAFMVFWLYNLNQFDLVSRAGVLYHKYDGVNALCMAIACAGMWDNLRNGIHLPRKSVGVICFFAGLFSLATLMANYPTFEPFGEMGNLLKFALSLPGGFLVCFHTLAWAVGRLPLVKLTDEKRKDRAHTTCFYLLTFASIAAVYLLYFFSVAYPGYYSEDSYQSIFQCISGEYNNTHPFWYTMLIRLCMTIGWTLGGRGNSMFCVYGIFQCLMMAAVFAYALVTLYQAGIPRWVMGVVYAMYTFLTYNLAYSATMWKDIPFSVSALLFIVAMYRILRGIGKPAPNYIVYALGSLLFCLMRTNGWYSFLAAALLMAVVLRKKARKLLMVSCGVLAAGWLCINPVLVLMGVAKTDFVETLAVPFQQIARVVVNECPMAESDMDMIEDIFYVDRMKEVYDPLTVDPVKFEAFRKDRRDFFKENLGDYVGLWLRLGWQYPWEYTKAWIDETMGFWNAGYHYWIYHDGGEQPDLGISRPELDNPVKDGFDRLFTFLQGNPLTTQLFYSIGFHVWILIFCFIVNLLRKQEEYLLTIPVMVIVLGLWVGTPVFAEFRYAYPVFLTVPFLLSTTVFRVEKPEEEEV